MVRQWQELFWEKRYSAVDTGSSPDFVKLAEAYGATGMRFEDKHTLVEDFKRVIATEGPVLVDVPVTREENVFPMIPAGKAPREMLVCQRRFVPRHRRLRRLRPPTVTHP